MRRILAIALALCFVAFGAAAQTGSVSGASVTPTGTTTACTLADCLSALTRVQQYGAACDVAYYTGGTATAGSTAYNAGAVIPATKPAGTHRIIIGGAGTNGAPLVTTYTSTGTSSLTLGTPAVLTTGSGVTYPVLSHVVANGTGYAPGDTIDLAGGTFAVRGQLTVRTTALTGSPTVAAGGSGGVLNGTATVAGTTGAGMRFILGGTIAGGALTAITSVYYAGQYTTNPTTIAAEPVAVYLGNPGNGMGVPTASGITGATVNLTGLMGALRADVTTPGSYTVLPTSPVAQNATSGGGTGATFTVGASTATMFSTGTDDTVALQAAATAGGSAWTMFPGNSRCAISGTIALSSNFTHFLSPGGAAETLSGLPVNTRSPLTTPVAPATPGLAWFGAAGGTMVKVSPPASGSPPLATGISVEGMDFQGNGVAGIGLQTLSVHGGTYANLNFADFTDTAIDISGADNTGIGASLQHNRYANIRGDQQRAPGTIMRLRVNAVGAPGNPSFNIFENISGNIADGDGIECINSDNNTFTNTHLFRVANTVGVGFRSYGAPATNGCRANRFMGFSSAGGMVFQGLESDTSASILNTLFGGPDLSNNDPLPVYGVGAQNLMLGSNGRVYGLQSSNAVFAKEIDLGKAASMTTDQAFGAPTIYGSLSLVSGNQQAAIRCNISIDASQNIQFVPSANCTYMDLFNIGVQLGTRVVTASGGVTTTFKDSNVCMNKVATEATAVTLIASPLPGQQITIADCKGDAAANNITITGSAAIDGGANRVINTNYGSWTGYYAGNIWKTK